MPKSIITILFLFSFYSFSQVIGGRNNSEMTPQVSKPSELSSGVYSGDVNLFSGDYNSSIQLGSVATPSGLSYSLSLNYSSAFSIGNTMPVSTGIPYGEGWNLNIPTISIETEVFNGVTLARYCDESNSVSPLLIDFSSFGNEVMKEGDVYWFSPYINIPGVASGRAVFKYIDVNDDKTAVFELNAFENHVEVRYNGETWVVIASDGTRYTFRTAVQSYNAPANKRLFYYDQGNTTTATNTAEDVQIAGYQNLNQAAAVENSILPKQKYNLWYCDAITHRNQPFQGINFTYKSFGSFNYFKEFDQEAYKYAAAEEFASSSFAKEHDFSCNTDLLLLKVEAISIDGLVDRLELKYATDKQLIQTNYNELIDYNASGNGRLDSLYSYQTIFSDGKADDKFDEGWKRYQHVKADSITNPDDLSADNPYITNDSYVRTSTHDSTQISFSHSFIESPRLMSTKLYPGDIYEVRSRITRQNATDEQYLFKNAGTFDLRIVTGDLQNSRGLDTTYYSTYNSNNGIHFSTANYNSSRSKVLYSTFNMALKWTLNYGEGDKQLSNLFVMPNIPTKYGGINFQIGPGNSDMNYAVPPEDIWDFNVADSIYELMTENAYIFNYGNPGTFALKSAADIPGNFGIGLPWNVVSPIYEYMITHENTFNYATADGKEAYHFWWNFNNPSLQNGVTTPNSPTKLDHTVKLDEFDLIRYSKNPYMLVGVNYYKVNGDVGGPVETGLHLISQKKLEYTSAKCKMLQNYDYEVGDTLRYRDDIEQVFILLKAVREVPVGWASDTTKLLTTFLSYGKFNNSELRYQDNRPLNGHFGMILTKIVDYLGGITRIEYYRGNDLRTRYTGAFLRESSSFCGIVSDPGYGLSRSDVVHPIVKYVFKNDEDDLVKNDSLSSSKRHKRWFYDFKTDSMVKKSTAIQITDKRFYNGRRSNFDVGFKKVSVYGPSLMEGSSEFVNRTDYVHYGGDFDYLISFPSIEDYLYHGKLKSVKEYDVNNKLFTEKLISYEYTLAYKNGYTRPNLYREDLVWEQEYDNPGLQYEYRDYYLNQPLAVILGTGPGATTVYGTDAYDLLNIPVFDGSGQDFELPKYLEFEFYPVLDTANPAYMFHSYFVKKKEEINRKYDDYLYKQAVVSGGTLPAPIVNTGPNPFGTGHVNPVIYDEPLAAKQIILINTETETAIVDSLTAHSPLMDSVLYHVINTTRLSDNNKIKLLLAQGDLSNLTLNRFMTRFGNVHMSGIYTSLAVINNQTYISDDVLLSTLPKLGTKWQFEVVEALFMRNEYLSDQVTLALANSSVYFNGSSLTKILSDQPQFSLDAIDKIIKSGNLIPADLPLILKNQVITDGNYGSIIATPSILNNTIVEVIETGNKYPSASVFTGLMGRSPAFSASEIERIIAVADRDIDPKDLSALITQYGNLSFLTGFSFHGNPLDAYCNNAVLSNWNYMETKTTYEYYEADYKGTSNGRAYKVLMGLEDIPGRTVSSTDVFGSGGTKTINSLRLKHEPSWQLFSVTNSSPHLPSAKDEKQYFYLYDLKNRYDRYWYNYDLKTINGVTSPFDHVIMNSNKDTVTFDTRWASEYFDGYTALAPVLPKFDGMLKSRQYAMRSTPFQQMHITKNQRDTKELRKSEYYFYDARWVVDPFSSNQTIEYNGPSCPDIGTPPVDPAGCASCMRWKYGTEQEFLAQLPFNYCLWKDPVIGYFACPSSINYAACFNGVELIDCNPSIPEEGEGGPAQMPILTDALKKTLQLRSTIIQLDTVLNAVSTEFTDSRFDRSNTQVAEFFIRGAGSQVDDQGFIRPFKMLFPYDTLTTAKVHKRNQHLQPALISNQVGLMTKFYYNPTEINWNVDTNCTNPNYSFLYNYSSVETVNIGLPVRVTVGYMRADSLGTDFEYTNDGQVSRMTSPSGHTMDYTFDGFNRLTSVVENGTRLLSRNEYQYWKHHAAKTFKERTEENYVYSVLFQNNTDTAQVREFQKAFMDPLGRTSGVVKAYRNEGDVQISSGSVIYDNWGRPQIQFKPIDSILSVTPAAPLKHVENLSSPLFNQIKYENDPVSLDIKHADPGEDIAGYHTLNKQTWITNAIYMSCELHLNRTELDLIMNGSTGSFRFLRTSVKDQDLKETITYSNAMGQTVATVAWANMVERVVTLYVYDSYGNLMKTINALRQHTDYQYNMLGQLVRETNVDGGEKRYIYNKHGKISGVQDQLDRNNVNGSNVPAPRFRKFNYDIYGNLLDQWLVTNPYHLDPFCFQNKTLGVPGTHYTDGSGNEHYFEYVFSNRMTQDWLNTYKTLDPLNQTTEIVSSGLPAVSPIATVIKEKSMLYGTLQSSPSALGKLIESLAYAPSGIAIQKINYTYNTEDLLASQVITQHPSNIATNDQFLVKATITYPAYNFRGSLLEEKLDIGSNGSVEMKYFYEYDQLNRLQKVFAAQSDVSLSTNATLMSSYVYDDARGTVAVKRLNGETPAAAQIISYTYDNRDRLTQIGSALFNEQLYYDNAIIPGYNGTMVTQTNTYNGNVKGTKVQYNFANPGGIPLFSKETIYGYQYDRINRLISADAVVGDYVDAQFGNPSNLNPGQSYLIGDEFWRYDRIGNLVIQDRTKPGAAANLGMTQEDFIYTYTNGTNRLNKVEDLVAVTARNYTYDANGNLLTDDFRDIDATVYMRGSYPYQVSQGTDQSYYLYDGGDQRIYKKVVTSAQTTQEMYIKDALGRDISIVKFITDGGTTTSATEYFVYGTDRVARVTSTGSGTLPSRIYFDEATFFLYDHLGNTRVAFQVDSLNKPLIVNALDYYSYGKILREYDNGAGDRYLTTGHERDQKTGLDYRGARYYDSDVARFLSTDPWAAKYPGWSTYNYVMGNPVRFIDPTGKGVDYTKEEAIAMAARGVTNGYKTEVVANPDKPDDYGVNYKRTVDGKEYEGVQYEGKFEGIVKGGLQKMDNNPSEKSQETTLDINPVGPALILSGQPIKALKPIGALGSKPGSSIASYTLSKAFPQRFTEVLGKKTGTKVATKIGTNVIGRAVGRAVPAVGWLMIINDIREYHLERQEKSPLYRELSNAAMTTPL